MQQRRWRPLESYSWYDKDFLIRINVLFAHALVSETRLMKIFCYVCSWNICHAHEPRRAVRYIKRMRMLGLMHLVCICLQWSNFGGQNVSKYIFLTHLSDSGYLYCNYTIHDLQIEKLWHLTKHIFLVEQDFFDWYKWQLCLRDCWGNTLLMYTKFVTSFVQRCCWCLFWKQCIAGPGFHRSCGACTGNTTYTPPWVCLCVSPTFCLQAIPSTVGQDWKWPRSKETPVPWQ